MTLAIIIAIMLAAVLIVDPDQATIVFIGFGLLVLGNL